MTVAVYEKVKSELERTRRPWTWLGGVIGVDKSAMTNWKTRGVPAKYHHPIADALGIRWEWLLGIDAQKFADIPASAVDDAVEVSDTAWDAINALDTLPVERRRQYRDMLMAEAAIWNPQLQDALAKHGAKVDSSKSVGNKIPLAPKPDRVVRVRKKKSDKAWTKT